jgi:hypothetical protein
MKILVCGGREYGNLDIPKGEKSSLDRRLWNKRKTQYGRYETTR